MIFSKKIVEVELEPLNMFKKWINVYTELYFLNFLIKKKFERCYSKDIEVNEITETDKFGNSYKLKVGMKVINIGEGEDMMIAEIEKFDDMDGKTTVVPFIKCLKSKSVYFTFGIVVPYSDELYDLLKILDPIERWNLLCRDHCQIEERNNKKYQTYEVESDYSLLIWFKNNSQKLFNS